eukprot:TRINITY_DN5746_c0_g2_i5.p1 TRINITY_DN5746_c0_g2~~TRINITY_DN5746_c0_g2_i5.p1  ORF type:complete len:970 (+),score=205.77 TRINITY_DN5746_c0_g2_i5:73-2982(+)
MLDRFQQHSNEVVSPVASSKYMQRISAVEQERLPPLRLHELHDTASRAQTALSSSRSQISARYGAKPPSSSRIESRKSFRQIPTTVSITSRYTPRATSAPTPQEIRPLVEKSYDPSNAIDVIAYYKQKFRPPSPSGNDYDSRFLRDVDGPDHPLNPITAETVNVCDSLLVLSQTTGAFGHLINSVKAILYRSIFVDYDDNWLLLDRLDEQNAAFLQSRDTNAQIGEQNASDSRPKSVGVESLFSGKMAYYDLLKVAFSERKMVLADRNKFRDLNRRLHAAAAQGPMSINMIINRWQRPILLIAFNHWKALHLHYRSRIRRFSRYIRCWKNFELYKAFNHWHRRIKSLKLRKNIWEKERLDAEIDEAQREVQMLGENKDILTQKIQALQRQLKEMHEQRIYQEIVMKERLQAEKDAYTTYIKIGSVLAEPAKADFVKNAEHVSQSKSRNIHLLLRENESIDNILSLPPDKLVLRWVNFHLKKKGLNRTIDNYAGDLRDCVVYLHLLNSIQPAVCGLGALDEMDTTKRATSVIESAEALGLSGIITEDNIINASPDNADMHLLFLIQLFSKYPCLEETIRQPNREEATQSKEQQSESPVPSSEDMEKIAIAQSIGYKGNDPLVVQQCVDFKHLEEIWSQVTTLADTQSEDLTQTVQELGRMYEEIQNSMNTAMDTTNKILETYEAAASQTEQLARQLLGHRLRGDKINAEEVKEQKDFDQYTKLNQQKIADLLEKEQDVEKEFAELENILSRYYLDIKSIYRNYSRGNTMSSIEFWEFVKDCKLPGPDLPSATIDLIFARCNWTIDEADDDENPDRELIPSEFIESLIRIGAAKHSKTAPSISIRLQKLLSENVLPRASKSDATKFRREIYDAPVQSVLMKHRAKLERIFLFYARQDQKTDTSKKHLDTINVNEFYQMCKECNYIDSSFSIRNVNTIFGNIQIDDETKKVSAEDKFQELIFPEFLEVSLNP